MQVFTQTAGAGTAITSSRGPCTGAKMYFETAENSKEVYGETILEQRREDFDQVSEGVDTSESSTLPVAVLSFQCGRARRC